VTNVEPPRPVSLVPGLRLAQYQIVAPIAAGGMGEVYRARDSRLDRDVAIKVMSSHVASDPAMRQRFESEARAVAALSHPSIMAIYELAIADGLSFAVMELLEGETLRERLGGGAMPWRDAVDIAASIADGLAAAHAKGVVHRDLKPENVLLERSGRVILTDFGVAALPSYDAQPTPGFSTGTPQYMSPEQLVGEHAIDGRSDLYALGVLGFTLLTGRPPFGGRTLRELSARHLLQRVPELARLAPHAPAALVAAIERCLAKDPAARWSSGRELHEALERGTGLDWKRWTKALRAAVI
jgi:serine/threonine protein kinase